MNIIFFSAQDLFPYPKDYKVQRKSVEKIHLSADSASLTNIPHPRQDSAIITEDYDTEKYLTNSSKKSKHRKKKHEVFISRFEGIFNTLCIVLFLFQNESSKASIESDEVRVFESPSVQVVTGCFPILHSPVQADTN